MAPVPSLWGKKGPASSPDYGEDRVRCFAPIRVGIMYELETRRILLKCANHFVSGIVKYIQYNTSILYTHPRIVAASGNSGLLSLLAVCNGRPGPS